MLKIIFKKCYWNDTNPELGKSNDNIKCDKKCKLDQAFVAHLQELSLLITFKLPVIVFIIIIAVQYITWDNYIHTHYMEWFNLLFTLLVKFLLFKSKSTL